MTKRKQAPAPASPSSDYDSSSDSESSRVINSSKILDSPFSKLNEKSTIDLQFKISARRMDRMEEALNNLILINNQQLELRKVEMDLEKSRRDDELNKTMHEPGVGSSFAVNSSGSVVQLSSLETVDRDEIRRDEDPVDFVKRIDKACEMMNLSNSAARAFFQEKAKKRINLAPLLPEDAKFEDAKTTFIELMWKPRISTEIMSDLANTKLNARDGGLAFVKRYGRLIAEIDRDPILSEIPGNVFFKLLIVNIGKEIAPKVEDCESAQAVLRKIIVLENEGTLFPHARKPQKKDRRPHGRHQQPYSSSSSSASSSSSSSAPSRDSGHREDRKRRDARPDSSSRGGQRPGFGRSQDRQSGRDRTVSSIEEYDSSSDEDDEFDTREQSHSLAYAIKARSPKNKTHFVYALVDTGASRSMMALKLARQWGCKILPHGGARFKAANNSSVHVAGRAIVPLQLGSNGEKVKAEVLVSPNISMEMILGTDFLNKHQAVIDVPHRRLCLKNKGQISLHTRDSDQVLMSLQRRFEKKTPAKQQQNEGDFRSIVSIDPNKKLPDAVRQEFAELVAQFPGLWSVQKEDINVIPIEEVGFEVTSNKPIAIYRKNRRSAAEEAAVESTVQGFLRSGVIRPSNSDYEFPVVVVPKGSDIRPVFDFSPFNPHVVDVPFPMPVVDDILDQLQGSSIYAVLDARAGFHQIAIKEECRHYLAFSTRSGKYEFCRLPMGLKISPAIFQKAMIKILRGLDFVHVFLDDILVTAKNEKELLGNLKAVFERLSRNNVLLNAQKCKIACDSVSYLGNVISKNGVSPDPKKIQGIKDMVRPKDVKGVRQFMGLVNYLRRFIKNCSTLCAPINDLTKKNARFKWTETQEEAFQEIKKVLTSDAVMAFPDNDVSVPFSVHVDTSRVGVGAVLMQKGRVICYASLKLDQHQRNYGATELEAFGLYWALRTLRHYILGHRIEVECDHRALQFIKAGMTSNPKLARWFSAISEFDYHITYTPGEKMEHVDCLSRLISSISEYSPIDPNRIAREQRKDKFCQSIDIKSDESFVRHNKLLCRVKDGERRVVVPDSMKIEIMREMHDNVSTAGHRGIATTTRLIREIFFWPKLAEDVKEFVINCVACQRRKSPKIGKQGFMIPSSTTNVWERIACDLVGPMTESKNGNKYILVVTDIFSKFSLAFPLKETSAETIAEILIDRIFSPFGIPKELLTDNGTNFKGKVMKKLCETYGISKLFTAPYRPQTDGQCERTNQVFVNTLAMTVDDNCDNWDELLPRVSQSYNAIVHSSTGFSPYEMIFGRKPRSPVQMALGVSADDQPADVPPEERLETIHKTAKKRLEKEHARQKENYDKNAHDPIPYRVGDIVMIKKEDHRASKSNKLDHRWTGPFEITKEISQVAFRIKRCFSNGRSQTANVNHMKPFCQPNKSVFTTLSDKQLTRWKKDIGNLKSDQMLSQVEDNVDENTEISIDQPNVYEIDKILIFRIVDGQKEVLLTWKGYPNERTWVHESQCRCKDNVLDFFSSRELRRIL